MTSCALVGASEFNAELFKMMADDAAFDLIIAVDGGVAHLEGIGVVPDMALGDFDSLGYVPQGMRVVRFSSHKDASDMELACERAKTMGVDRFFAFAALGGRLDHTLANLQIFAALSESGFEVSAFGLSECVTFITGPACLELSARTTGTVSVFSLSDEACGITECGLAYALSDERLTNRTSRGLSNEFIGEDATVSVRSGTLAIFTPPEI